MAGHPRLEIPQSGKAVGLYGYVAPQLGVSRDEGSELRPSVSRPPGCSRIDEAYVRQCLVFFFLGEVLNVIVSLATVLRDWVIVSLTFSL
jgi:hypothetical protein